MMSPGDLKVTFLTKMFPIGPFISCIYYTFNGHFCHYFQCTLVGLNFLARTVSYTFLEMFLAPEQNVGGAACIF